MYIDRETKVSRNFNDEKTSNDSLRQVILWCYKRGCWKKESQSKDRHHRFFLLFLFLFKFFFSFLSYLFKSYPDISIYNLMFDHANV